MTGNLRREPHNGRGADRKVTPLPVAVRAAVSRRSGGQCEWDAERVWGPGTFKSSALSSRCGARAVHKHHVRMKSLGGTDAPANLADLCSEHHRWVHDNPDAARALGLLT